MKLLKLSSKTILIMIISLQLMSCQRVGDPIVKKSLRSFSELSLTSAARIEVENLETINKEVRKEIKGFPRLNDSQDVILEGNEAVSYVNSVQRKMLELSDNVKKISSVKFKTNKEGIPTSNPTEMGQFEHLTLLNLLALRDMAQSSAATTFRLMNFFDREEYDNNTNVLEIKQKLLAHYLDSLSVMTITENDLKATMKNLVSLRENHLLSTEAESQIDDIVSDLKEREDKIKKEMTSFVNNSLTDKAQDKLTIAIKEHQLKVAGKTFLFDPAHPDHPAIHVMVIVSNLSWGLINTMVGLGFVLTAAILAPVTHIAGSIVRAFGYRPLFYEIKFPKLRIARNHMQIYADVCGLGIVPGKMSAGMFELDFCSGQNFASAHEGGHAKQSALLGPLYFPAAILSYIINMGHGGFIESWADTWYVR